MKGSFSFMTMMAPIWSARARPTGSIGNWTGQTDSEGTPVVDELIRIARDWRGLSQLSVAQTVDRTRGADDHLCHLLSQLAMGGRHGCLH